MHDLVGNPENPCLGRFSQSMSMPVMSGLRQHSSSGVNSELNLDRRPHKTAVVALESSYSCVPTLQYIGSAAAAAGPKTEAFVPHLSGSVPAREEPQAAAGGLCPCPPAGYAGQQSWRYNSLGMSLERLSFVQMGSMDCAMFKACIAMIDSHSSHVLIIVITIPCGIMS